MPSTILSDNGASSGSAGLKSTAGNDGVLILQTTTSGGTATNAIYVDTSQRVGIKDATIGANALSLRAIGNSYSNGALALQDAAGTSKNYITAIAGTVYVGDNSSNDCATVNQYGVGLGGNAATSGLGIRFPATQSASSDANTLDDYEEGGWTPALTGATFSTTAAGTYVKVGQVVTVWGYMSFSYSSPTSTFYINNLPFTVYDNTNVRGGAGTVMCQSGVTFNNYVTIEPINASVVAYFENNISGSNRADMGSSNFASGGSVIRFTATYRTSA